MRKFGFLAFAAALSAALGASAIERHDDSYVRDGVTYAQRGGMSAETYVVTNVDMTADDVGAVSRDETWESVSNKAMTAIQTLEPATNYTDEVSRQKRDKTDLKVYRKVKDIWRWTNWEGAKVQEPLAKDAPADFLALANSPGSEPIHFERGAWWGAVQFWPNGNVKYSQSEIPPGGTGELSTTVNFAMYAYDETGTNEIYRFGATATREDPTNETVVAWDETRNQYVRVATTDMVDESVRRGVAAKDGAARPLPPYLHYMPFDDVYTNDAAWYYEQAATNYVHGSCSARRVGGILERNYDWEFDRAPEFVIPVSGSDTRFASVGIANVGRLLTEDFVTSGKWSRHYRCLPGHTLDGVNENGVVAEINVVGGDPFGWRSTGDIHPLGAVRWALDNGTSAEMVATSLAVRVKFPAGWSQNFHYMIADAQETWIVENGAAHMVGTVANVSVMTNFRLFPTPDDYGEGQERYAILTDTARPITDAWFTRCYKRETTPPWVSDLREVLAYTNAIYDAWATHDREFFRDMAIDGKRWWQTVHTAIYDFEAKTLKVCVQENADWYVFAVGGSGRVKSVNGKVGHVTLDSGDVGAYSKDEADDKFLTANLVGKTLVSGTNTLFKLGAGTRIEGTDDGTYQLGGGTLTIPDNLQVTVGGNRTLATWGIQDALKDDEDWLAENDNFKAAVERVSPPVVLPEKWALANVTNASGNAVSSDDVGALSKQEAQSNYETIQGASEKYAEKSVTNSIRRIYAGDGRKYVDANGDVYAVSSGHEPWTVYQPDAHAGVLLNKQIAWSEQYGCYATDDADFLRCMEPMTFGVTVVKFVYDYEYPESYRWRARNQFDIDIMAWGDGDGEDATDMHFEGIGRIRRQSSSGDFEKVATYATVEGLQGTYREKDDITAYQDVNKPVKWDVSMLREGDYIDLYKEASTFNWVIIDKDGNIASTRKGDIASTSIEWSADEWDGGYDIVCYRTADDVAFAGDSFVTSQFVTRNIRRYHDVSKADADKPNVKIGQNANAQNTSVSIGASSSSLGQFGTAVGYGAIARGGRSLALGTRASATSPTSTAIGYLATSHGEDTFNVSQDIGRWYAGEDPFLSAMMKRYVQTNMVEVVTNDTPLLAASPSGSIVTNVYTIYVPDGTGARIAYDDKSSLARMMTDAATNHTEECDCISTNICKIIAPHIKAVNVVAEHWDATLEALWSVYITDGDMKFSVRTNEDATAFREANSVLTDETTEKKYRVGIDDGEMKFFTNGFGNPQ